MALINCSECEAQISDKAHACPHCGFPMKTAKQEVKSEGSKVVSFLGTAFLLVICCAFSTYISILALLNGLEIGLLGGIIFVITMAVFGGFIGSRIAKLLYK